MSDFGFCGASEQETTVFGAQRPGYHLLEDVDENTVRECVDFMKVNGIKRVVCLLPQEQLDYYTEPLLYIYEEEFGRENVLWAPVSDYHLCDKKTLARILYFLKEADDKGEKVVVHCSGGSGRTGHVLAAWLVFGRGFSAEEAILAVERSGRNPYEAIEYGNAEEEDLVSLLDFARILSHDRCVKIALVGLGGAGSSILQKVVENRWVHKLIDAYVVDECRRVEDARFYGFEHVEKLIEKLSEYDHVILTAGLGGSGGDYLVYLSKRLENVAAVFVSTPFKFEKIRRLRAEEQLLWLRGYVFVNDLDRFLTLMPNMPVAAAMKLFDTGMAEEILNKVVELVAEEVWL
jgi:protein-tyrosine phosphatase